MKVIFKNSTEIVKVIDHSEKTMSEELMNEIKKEVDEWDVISWTLNFKEGKKVKDISSIYDIDLEDLISTVYLIK